MFWDLFDGHEIALIDDSTSAAYTYTEVNRTAVSLASGLRSATKKLVFHFCDNSAEDVIIYLAALKSGNALFLINAKMNRELKKKLTDLYKPEIIFNGHNPEEQFTGYALIDEPGIPYFERTASLGEGIPHKDLAVLLSTSGTTGSPKLVKLSYKNLQSNAESISEYLNITGRERAITSLPVSYSYGLSVINSHLLKKASVICTNKSLVMRDFWNVFNKYKCTSFSGVPYSYQMLKRLKFDQLDLPSLKTMTQAGGRLGEELIEYFLNTACTKGYKFFVMYGQTEATARIAYVPFEKLKDKIGSVGIPIPGGKMGIKNNGGESQSGELIYEGANVMMGYAQCRTDLSKGDELNGVLCTGDIAFTDVDGYYYISGREKDF